MKVHFVGAGPGDPDLLTRKAHGLLTSAQCCIYTGSLVSPEVVGVVPAQCETFDSAAMSLEEIVAVFQGYHDRDVDVVRLHTGEPAIYGAINEQMERLDALGIDYDVVPGISSFQAAAAVLRTQLTAPEVAQAVIITRMAGRTPVPPEQAMERLAASRATLCIFLSTHKVDELAQTLVPTYGRDCPAAAVYRASWPDEQVVQGTLADIAGKVSAAGFRKTAIILVGWALGHRGTVSKLYDAMFTHEYREVSQT